MQAVHEILLKTAQNVAAVYAAHPNARAVAVVGSLARGQTDDFSDIDMTAVYYTLPTEEEIAAGRETLGATEWRRFPSGEIDGLADFFRVKYQVTLGC